MATASGTWKAFERMVAERFGTRRQIGSGSGGRPDQTRSDSVHPRLFISCKYRDGGTAVHSLYEEELPKAEKEGKFPVLALKSKGKQGYLIVVHSNNLDAFASEVLASMTTDPDDAHHDGVTE